MSVAQTLAVRVKIAQKRGRVTLLTYQIFKTVSEAGSFHKAAEILGLTPSAISHAVASMEKELGSAVFTRGKNGVNLTSYGEHLLPYVNGVLGSDESLRQAVAEFNGLKQGTVKVGCFSSVCTHWMPDIIKSFGELYPAIEIEVFQGTYDDVRYWIRNGIVDFGFLSTLSAGDLPVETFYRDPLVCVTPGNYGKSAKDSTITIEEMAKMHFVAQRESTDADIQNYLRENRLDVETKYHVVDDLAQISMVASGFGICIMPSMVMKDMPYDVRIFRMDPDAARFIGLSALNTQLMAPAARTLYQHIMERYCDGVGADPSEERFT